MTFLYVFVARNKDNREENISFVSHRTFHWKSFYEFQKRIFDLKCNECDDQKGIIWKTVENHNLSSGHNIIYRLLCDNPFCHSVLLDEYESSPRVEVQFIHNKTEITNADNKSDDVNANVIINHDLSLKISEFNQKIITKRKFICPTDYFKILFYYNTVCRIRICRQKVQLLITIFLTNNIAG